MQEKNISIINAMLHPFKCLNMFCDEGAIFYQVLVYEIAIIIYNFCYVFEAFFKAAS